MEQGKWFMLGMIFLRAHNLVNGWVSSGTITLRKAHKSTIFSKSTPEVLLFSNKYNLEWFTKLVGNLD